MDRSPLSLEELHDAADHDERLANILWAKLVELSPSGHFAPARLTPRGYVIEDHGVDFRRYGHGEHGSARARAEWLRRRRIWLESRFTVLSERAARRERWERESQEWRQRLLGAADLNAADPRSRRALHDERFEARQVQRQQKIIESAERAAERRGDG